MYGVLCPHCTETYLTASLDDERKKNMLLKHGVNNVLISKGCPKCRTQNGDGKEIFGNVLGKVQPYVEYLLLSEELKSKLLSCIHPYEMEQILKKELMDNKSSLEYRLITGIKEGKLSIDSLDDIL